MVKNKKLTSIFICVLFLCISQVSALARAESRKYDTIEFVGEADDEMDRLLLAKLTYDYLDGYEGKTIDEYVRDNPDLYSGEIWKDSGITYEALYGSLVGDWEIYEVFNNNKKSGFYAVAFRHGDEIVLSFRGSEMFTDEFVLDSSNDWTGTDFKFAVFNELSSQFDDADNAVKRLERLLASDGVRLDTADITLAGHSLGGALVAYESIVSGYYGYSFDGACGHVIDLIYYYRYLDIDDFEGLSADNDHGEFCNYTDEEGYAVADLIQHTNTGAFYQIDRKTKLDGLNENTLIPRLSDAGSHIIWSCVDYEDNRVFFTDKVLKDDEMYTYVPDGVVCLDIYKNILETTLEDFPSFDADYKEILGSLTGVTKDGRVMLADCAGGTMYAYENIGVSSMFDVNAVMYGGRGGDSMYGYVADDVLIGGCNEPAGTRNVLDGNLGNDVYVVDRNPGTQTDIADIGGDTSVVILRNMNIKGIDKLVWDDSGVLLIPELNQRISFDVAQCGADVRIYAYQKDKLMELGCLSDLQGYREGDVHDEDKYVVMLEGKGEFVINGDDGLVVVDNTSSEAVRQDISYGTCYVCCEQGKESIIMVLDEPYDVRVSNRDERVNLAIGKYNPSDGMTACERKYNRRFRDYRIYFTEGSLDDGEQGEITIQDVVYAGVDLFMNVLGR